VADIEKIKKDLKINSFDKLTKQQVYDLLRYAGNGKISVEILEQISKIAPSFINLAVDQIKSLSDVSESARAGHVGTKESIDSIVSTLSTLTQNQDLDLETKRFICEKLVELAKVLERVQADNNSFFSSHGGNILKAGAALLGLLFLASRG